MVFSSFSIALSIALTPGSRSKFWRMKPSSASRKCEASRSDSEETSRPPISTVPAVGASSVATISSSVVLPDPLGPYSATISPGRDRQRHAVHGAHGLAAHGGVVLDEVAQLQHRVSIQISGMRAEAIPGAPHQSDTLPLTCTVMASLSGFRIVPLKLRPDPCTWA